MKILIGYDGSPSARAVLDDLRRAGLPAEAEVLIVTVGDVWMPPPDVEMHQAAMASRRVSATMARLQTEAEQTLEEAKRISGAAARRIKADFPGWRVETEAMTGEAGWAIIHKAAEWQADLIIIGTQNRSAIGRFFLGSVSQKIVIEAHCSVRVARRSDDGDAAAIEKDAPRRIVAGVDDSDAADAILETIARRNWTRGSVLRLVTATDAFQPDAARPFRQIFSAQEFHKQAREKLAATNLKILTAVKIGEARAELLAEAEKLRADTIFVGTRDIRGTLDRFFINSVSAGVATNAPCSVEVVRAPAN